MDLITLSTLSNVTIYQKTPIRVLHRRSALIREKIIYSISINYINAHWFICDLITSSGTYIKEFVHGDRDRTIPSISSLLKSSCECVQLDVMGVSVYRTTAQ